MDSDFQSKLQSVLSNPEALAKITDIASSLGGSQRGAEEENGEIPNPSLPLKPNFSTDPRLELLNSLKPLLREDKRSRIDSISKALTVASMMKSFRK